MITDVAVNYITKIASLVSCTMEYINLAQFGLL
jgi:hypothetical protein